MSLILIDKVGKKYVIKFLKIFFKLEKIICIMF